MPEQQTTHYAAPITNMRDRFLRYVEGDGTETPGAGEAPPAPTTPPVPAPPATPPAPVAENVSDLPQWAQDKLAALNRENASTRVNAKQQAADEARAELLRKLGLTKDGEETPDPAKLAADLTAKDAALRTLTVERALDKAARKAGADEDLLAAVLAHKGALGKLDPTAADFTTQLEALVKTEVDGNPKLKAARAAGASGVELGGGTGEQGQLTAAQIARMTPEQIVEADNKGLLRDYMAS